MKPRKGKRGAARSAPQMGDASIRVRHGRIVHIEGDIEALGLAIAHAVIDANEAAGPSCRVCGCTNDDPCENGCSWVEPDLCSACVPPRAEPKPKKRGRR